MSEKTNYSRAIPWLIALCIAIIILYVSNLVPYIAKSFSPAVFFAPVTQAVSISTIQAINAFSEGVSGTDPFWSERLYILGSIILFFVVGPALWMSSIKSSTDSKNMAWYAGVTLVMMGFMISIPGIFSRGISPDANRDQIERNRNMDKVRAELSTLNHRAMELYWLPVRHGGTENDLSAITLAELKEQNKFNNDFVLKTSAKDSSLIIYGIGDKEGKNPDFQNVNGEQGKIQLAFKLKPKKLHTEQLWADSLRN